jgi:ATP-dependent helicase Lhr and Lhr-like helicase
VLAQHLLALACAEPFTAEEAYAEVRTSAPYRDLSRAQFQDVLSFIQTGGYALKSYDRFRRLVEGPDGRYRIAHPKIAHQHRLNAGAIVEAPTLSVKFRNGGTLGKVEEYFATALSPGDTFVFAGRMLEFVAIRDADLIVTHGKSKRPQVPSYQGGRLPLSTNLANRVRRFLHDPASWHRFPAEVGDWLELQRDVSVLPDPAGLLVETFPRDDVHFLVAYTFEGRNAHQSLGLLLTRRMEKLGYAPLGFVGSDYVIAAWSLKPVTDVVPLFAPDILADEFQLWMAQSSLLKRSFRDVSIISGLIERQHPGKRKTGRQLMASSDLIYDVLRQYEPDHILLRATWADARGKITDLDRLGECLERVQGRITHKALSRVSPLAVPVLLEIGKEQVYGSAEDLLLGEAEALIAEATQRR